MRPRLFAAIGLACVLAGAILLMRNAPEPLPHPQEGAEPLWPDVVDSFDHWIESGPRRTGFTLMLAGGACVLISIYLIFRRSG